MRCAIWWIEPAKWPMEAARSASERTARLLPSEAAAAMAGWLDAAKLRAGALVGDAELDRALGATN